jgi:hypothetical protein
MYSKSFFFFIELLVYIFKKMGVGMYLKSKVVKNVNILKWRWYIIRSPVLGITMIDR